ncbi:MAG: inositol monophosphatase family protein [Nannocystaceae bacterium]
MKLSARDLAYLSEQAVEAARVAGTFIARSRPHEVQTKTGGSSLASRVVTEIDRRSQQLILELLEPTCRRFELATLAEEDEDDGERLRADHFWCIDPLDGTLPFIESTPGYAVSIALVSRAGQSQLGVVYDPVEGVMYRATRGQGLRRGGTPWTPDSHDSGPALTLFTDRSFRDIAEHDRIVVALERIAKDVGLEGLQLGPSGGAVINACRVLSHPPACYFKLPKPGAGGGSLWDYAATACMFDEAGAIATDMSGAPLDLNRADSTFMNHRGVLFATDPRLAAQLRTLPSPYR